MTDNPALRDLSGDAHRPDSNSSPYSDDALGVPKVGIALLFFGFLLCWPIGGLAIWFAVQVKKKLALGDVASASRARTAAIVTSWISIVVGLLLTISSLAGA